MIAPYLTPMNYKFDAEVDKFINDLLDKEPHISDIGEHDATFQINGKRIGIWASNRWHAYASNCYVMNEIGGREENIWDNKRPSRKTMIRLYKYITYHAPAPELMPTLDEVLAEKHDGK